MVDNLAAIAARLESLSLQEDRLREELRSVREHKAALEAERAVLQPPGGIRSLPPELLIQIFEWLVCSDTNDTDDYRDLFSAPIAVSHVCRGWRALAIRTSQLWSRMFFDRFKTIRTYVKRAKSQPLHIVHAPAHSLSANSNLLKGYLTSTVPRWQSMYWRSSVALMRPVLHLLNENVSFPNLCMLVLSVPEKRPALIPLRKGSSFVDDQAIVRFPALEHLKLHRVAPSELPPLPMPRLRILQLQFSNPAPLEGPHLVRMSNLCALLWRAPNLQEFMMNNTVPLLDIHLRINDSFYPLPVASGSRQTHLFIAPISLKNLVHFSWGVAPARDLWRLFCFLDMPSLRELELFLGPATTRWTQFFLGVLSETESTDPWADALSRHPVIHFTNLEELRVICQDTDGLSVALKKMHFPALQRLELAHIVPSASFRTIPTPDPQLPRIESIFRDPRLPLLTHLTLIAFTLHPEDAPMMLQYMPALLTLSLDACPGACKLICSLSGSFCGAGISSSTTLACPRLENLVLKECDDLRFRCLQETVRARRFHAEMNGSWEQVGYKRRYRPLKRRALQQEGLAGFKPPQTPPRRPGAAVGPTSPTASPNGSFVAGWAPHERAKPARIRSVFVEGCMRVSEAELTSLHDDTFAVETVVWIA